MVVAKKTAGRNSFEIPAVDRPAISCHRLQFIFVQGGRRCREGGGEVEGRRKRGWSSARPPQFTLLLLQVSNYFSIHNLLRHN